MCFRVSTSQRRDIVERRPPSCCARLQSFCDSRGTTLFMDPDDPNITRVGEVRALVRRPGGDVAVVCELAAVPDVPGCPLLARGSTRLAWLIDPATSDAAVCAVPMAFIRRVVHVVPDFADLGTRRGFDALPAELHDSKEDRQAMRCFEQ